MATLEVPKEIPELDINQDVWNRWKDRLPKDKRFFAFIDGDLVGAQDDFVSLEINASTLRSQRGERAILSIFDRESDLFKLCLLDFSLDDLQRILGDENLSKMLTEYDESSALAHIDELINRHEAPITGLLLNDKSILDVRNEWTIKVPPSINESIQKFLER